MAFDRIVEAMIREAMERSELDNLPGKGKPIDLTEYFETPEEVRLANSVLTLARTHTCPGRKCRGVR
jgi:hypothetical protein